MCEVIVSSITEESQDYKSPSHNIYLNAQSVMRVKMLTAHADTHVRQLCIRSVGIYPYVDRSISFI